ncbi:hypothetical protein KY49_6702 [Burkholderia sp. MSHR3999]|nr:hypothetical protein KY49_6702 [Burkholderia sp. MSHR3999]
MSITTPSEKTAPAHLSFFSDSQKGRNQGEGQKHYRYVVFVIGAAPRI